jgi:hypothetical protein
MKINAFFTKCLRSPLHNPVWSWGSHDKKSNRVFLRVGEWAVSRKRKQLTVYHPDWDGSNGGGERQKHLESIRNGAQGYAVVVRFNDSGKIVSFDDEKLIVLGDIFVKNGLTFARIDGEINTEEIGFRKGSKS